MHFGRWNTLSLAISLAIAGGCGQANSQPSNLIEVAPPSQGNNFDPATAGTIRGEVVWQGKVPQVSPFLVRANPIGGDALAKRQVQPNPNTPAINPQNNGVGNAVIFLRGVDLTKAKPWNLPAVRIEQRDLHLQVLQGDVDSSYGFVRRGDPIEMVSRDPYFHSLHGDGASFFSLVFPDPGQPLSRGLKEKGVVELTSAAGYYWMRAYVFVDDHPYYTRTDAEGRFTLDQVPPGNYEVVCWIPSWREARHERDPESGLITRLIFRPPVSWVESVTLLREELKEVSFAPSMAAFQR